MLKRIDDASSRRERERRVQKQFAERHGYAWARCPLCGEPFGGHEPWAAIAPVPAGSPADETFGPAVASPGVEVGDPMLAQGICGWCACDRLLMAEQLLRDLGENVSFSTTSRGKTVEHHVPGGFEQPE
jgi:hypothetical protein